MDVGFRTLRLSSDWSWVRQRTGAILTEDTTGIVAMDKATGRVLAAVVLDTWSGSSVQAHIVIERPIVLRHGLFELVSDYVYRQAGCLTIAGVVPADNEKALKLDRHLGFKEVGRIHDGYAPGVDSVIMEMRRSDCRFLNSDTVFKGADNAVQHGKIRATGDNSRRRSVHAECKQPAAAGTASR